MPLSLGPPNVKEALLDNAIQGHRLGGSMFQYIKHFEMTRSNGITNHLKTVTTWPGFPLKATCSGIFILNLLLMRNYLCKLQFTTIEFIDNLLSEATRLSTFI